MSTPSASGVALVFPGQGSQSVGMLGEWAAESPLIRQSFEEAGEALGLDLWQISQEGPAGTLDRTDVTQPAILAGSVALWRVYREKNGPTPDRLAGHSLGEYSALVAAGALDFPDAVRLVADRGRFMQEAVAAGEGAMAAILGLDGEHLEAVCTEAAQGQVVTPVNFNAPGQIVIAGHRDAVARAIERARADGAKRAVELPVSVPSHCSLMEPAAERLRDRLSEVEVRTPGIPVLHNRTVESEVEPSAIRERLVEQLSGPVRWSETIERFAASGIRHVLECGPGKVLSGLTRRIDRKLNGAALSEPSGFYSAIEEVRS